MKPHPKPTVCKDPQWLKAIRLLPCWAATAFPAQHQCADTIGTGPSEASHLDGKSRDDRTLPMCGYVHRTGKYAWHHGQQTFCQYYGTTKAEMIRQAEQLYRDYQEFKNG